MKLRPFELVLLTLFAVIGLIALGLLATYRPAGDSTGSVISSPVVIWGTVSASAFEGMLRSLREADESYRFVSYQQKDPLSFDLELLNALAESRGPDVVLLPHDRLVQHRSKILPIAYDSYPRRDFQNSFIDGSEIFMLQDGVYGIPVMVDPLMLYWNRDLLSTFGFIAPPNTWEKIVNEIIPQTVNRDFNRNIIRSPLAFGEYRNVRNAYEVLSLLLLQGGSNLVQETETSYRVDVNNSTLGNPSPLTNALSFYTGFANPSNSLYTWNRSLPEDRSHFISEQLILYFGKGSEARGIAAQNPNLNFDIAEVPQGATSNIRRTYGTFYGFSLLRSSENRAGAYAVMQELAQPGNAQQLVDALGMAPAHRSTLVAGSNDRYGRLIYSSAVVARGWLNPTRSQVDDIFVQSIEDILANRRRPSEAASDVAGRLRLEY